MARIAPRKIHFAPLETQDRAIRRLLRARRHANVTELMRRAIDVYLERVEGPSLEQQARWMAEDFRREDRRAADASRLQDASRAAAEDW
jgi:hypothetical protein